MKRRLPLFIVSTVLFILSLKVLQAAPRPGDDKPTISATAGNLGITSSLTTSGFLFNQPTSLQNLAGADSFAASFVVTNRTRQPIVFTRPGFPTSTSLRPILSTTPFIVFQMFDDEGGLVWESWTAPADAPEIELVLGPGSGWKSTVRVPLRIDGTALAEGTYKLRASVIGTPEVSATTSFAVRPLTIIIGTTTSR